MSELGQQLIAETRKVVEANPDFVYSGVCRYVKEGQPSCLIGHALWNLNLIDGTLEDSPHNGNSSWGIINHLELDVDPESMDWLSYAQSRQDSGYYTWAGAISEADRLAGN